MIVAVAEESRGAEHARQWIEQAKAEYWCLIDAEHHVAELYGMVNVPQAVWIDETGHIVRPPGDRRIDRSFPHDGPHHAIAGTGASGGAQRGAHSVSGCGARLGAERTVCASRGRGA